MHIVRESVFILAALSVLAALQSCKPPAPPSGTYKVDTFRFVHSHTPQNSGGPTPKIWIDANTEVDLTGGTVTSSLPCAVRIDYTDNSATLKDAVFTDVKITYDDDTVDSSTAAIELPLRIAGREYESVNSVSGGRIVRSTSWIISGKIPKVVTRADPFRLQMEGYFTKVDGGRVPFAIDQHFGVEKEQATKDAAEVLQDW